MEAHPEWDEDAVWNPTAEWEAIVENNHPSSGSNPASSGSGASLEHDDDDDDDDDDSSPAWASSSGVRPGACVGGRYLVLAPIELGARDRVLAAFDSKLDRHVALKMWRPGPGTNREAARARLQEDAQTFAKLNHENHVRVYDVGLEAGQMFVAMEPIPGQTLGAWMRGGPGGRVRPWREVIEIFAGAGRGLAAAHSIGLVHGAFEPDTVVVGDEGRVRVAQFGLARAADGDLALVYAAPEQLAGGEATAQADQFSFCVALFEALYGVRPFAGESRAELLRAIDEGRIAEPRRGAKVPGWLREVVLRGLSQKPAARFASMDELLGKVGSADLERRRTLILAGVVVAAFVVASVSGYLEWDETRRKAACVAEGDAISEIWNDEAREPLRDAVAGVEVAHAAETADRVVGYLDAQAASWRDVVIQSCLDAQVRDEWSANVSARSSWCLEQRRLELEALLAELTAADEQLVARAVSAASSMTPVAGCRDLERLRAAPTPPELGEGVRGAMTTLARARARWAVGRHEQGLTLAIAAVDQAEAASWAPLTASARTLVGQLQRGVGQLDEAERTLEQAYFEAAQAGALEIAGDAATVLTAMVGRDLGRPEDGRRWARHAEVALFEQGVGVGDPPWARLLEARGTLEYAAGDYEAARGLFERAVTSYEQALGPGHPRVAANLERHGAALVQLGELEQAKREVQRALEIHAATRGEAHPRHRSALGVLADIELELGAHANAPKLSIEAGPPIAGR